LDPGSEILQPGWKKIRIRHPGIGINIPDFRNTGVHEILHFLEDIASQFFSYLLPASTPQDSIGTGFDL
jgi:hypothetical protein